MLKFSGRGGAEHTIPEVRWRLRAGTRQDDAATLSVAGPTRDLHLFAPRRCPAVTSRLTLHTLCTNNQEEKRAFADHINSNVKVRRPK